jgi:uncharacterized protein RhaS with RHS repeats
VKQTDPEGKEASYAYDLDGRLTKTLDGNGNETWMEYDVTLGTSRYSVYPTPGQV